MCHGGIVASALYPSATFYSRCWCADCMCIHGLDSAKNAHVVMIGRRICSQAPVSWLT